MMWQSHAHTEQGPIRDHNEDALLANDANGFWLLADGMGGHAGGEVASQLACTTVAASIVSGEALCAAAHKAHQQILDHAAQNPHCQGMGTTLVAAQAKGRTLHLAWVGDSRIYRWRPNNNLVPLEQLSRDHSFVQDLIDRNVLTREEAHSHPQKNLVNQALGQANLKRLRVDERKIEPKPGDLFMLCSDGVHDMLDDTAIAHSLATSNDMSLQAQALQKAVLATEASDNFSFLLIRYQPTRLRRWLDTLNFPV